MYTLFTKDIELNIDTGAGIISSLKLGEAVRTHGACPIFRIRLRDLNGACYYIDSTKSNLVSASANEFVYNGFGGDFNFLTVRVIVRAACFISWQM